MSINIRPVSDLRNKYPELEKLMADTGQPVFLTKNGCGSAVLMTLEQYEDWDLDMASVVADIEEDEEKNGLQESYTLEEVMAEVRERIRKDAAELGISYEDRDEDWAIDTGKAEVEAETELARAVNE